MIDDKTLLVVFDNGTGAAGLLVSFTIEHGKVTRIGYGRGA
jgi:hypothetical protein